MKNFFDSLRKKTSCPTTLSQPKVIAFSEKKEVLRALVQHWTFHAIIYAGASNPFLAKLIRFVNERVERHLRIQLTRNDNQDAADREHREIPDACRKHDADKAAEKTKVLSIVRMPFTS